MAIYGNTGSATYSLTLSGYTGSQITSYPSYIDAMMSYLADNSSNKVTSRNLRDISLTTWYFSSQFGSENIGGPSGSIQYNNSGVLGGVSGINTDGSDLLFDSGSFIFGNGTYSFIDMNFEGSDGSIMIGTEIDGYNYPLTAFAALFIGGGAYFSNGLNDATIYLEGNVNLITYTSDDYVIIGYGYNDGDPPYTAYVSIDSSLIDGNYVIQFPNKTGTQIFAMLSDVSGGGSPGGSDMDVQYNSEGSFAGSSNFQSNGTDIGINNTNMFHLNGLADANWGMVRKIGNGSFVTSNALVYQIAGGTTDGTYEGFLMNSVDYSNNNGNVFEMVGYTGQAYFDNAISIGNIDPSSTLDIVNNNQEAAAISIVNNTGTNIGIQSNIFGTGIDIYNPNPLKGITLGAVDNYSNQGLFTFTIQDDFYTDNSIGNYIQSGNTNMGFLIFAAGSYGSQDAIGRLGFMSSYSSFTDNSSPNSITIPTHIVEITPSDSSTTNIFGVYNSYGTEVLNIVNTGQILMFDQYGNTSIDVDNRWIIDNNEIVSIDFGNRFLVDYGGTYSVDYNNRILEDGNEVTSVDWENRKLFIPTTLNINFYPLVTFNINSLSGTITAGDACHTNNSTFTVTSTDNSTYVSGFISFGDCSGNIWIVDDTSGANANVSSITPAVFNNGDTLSDSNTSATSTIVSVFWHSSTGFSTCSFGVNVISGNFNNGDTFLDTTSESVGYISSQPSWNNAIVANWNTQILIDLNGSTSLNWESRITYDSGGAYLSIDWSNRYLIDSGGTTTLNWETLILIDQSSTSSLDWENRYLYDISGDSYLTFGNGSSPIVSTDIISLGYAQDNFSYAGILTTQEENLYGQYEAVSNGSSVLVLYGFSGSNISYLQIYSPSSPVNGQIWNVVNGVSNGNLINIIWNGSFLISPNTELDSGNVIHFIYDSNLSIWLPN